MTAKVFQTYVHRGRDFDIVTRAEGEVKDQLPIGLYRINFHPMRGWWFSSMKPFDLPKKLYGNVEQRSRRILDTYYSRMENGKATGVLLEGIKGSGKTLLAKKVAMDSNLPVIIVNEAHTSDDFKEIISNIGPCVVIFDEFEKVYHKQEDQNAVLTLLDGVFSSQILTFIIVNDSSKLVGPLKNRPGRLYYSLEYAGLSEAFISEYSRDRLQRKITQNNDYFGTEYESDEDYEKRLKSIISVSSMFNHFTFDHLQAMIEEMNRYGEAADQVVEYLNIKLPKPSIFDVYEVRIWKDGKEITSYQKQSFKVQNSVPTVSSTYLYFKETPDDEEEECVYLSPNNLGEVDINTKTFTFYNQKEGVRVVYRKMNDEEKYRSYPSPF